MGFPGYQARIRTVSEESNEGVVDSCSDDGGAEKVLSSSISMSRQFIEATQSIKDNSFSRDDLAETQESKTSLQDQSIKNTSAL